MIICSSLSLNEQLLVKVLQKLKLKDNITPTRFGKYLMQLDIFSIDSPVRLWPTKSALCEAVPSSALQWFRAKKKGGLTCIPLQLESMAPGWQKHTHGGKKKKKTVSTAVWGMFISGKHTALEAYVVVSPLWVHERWTSGKVVWSWESKRMVEHVSLL